MYKRKWLSRDGDKWFSEQTLAGIVYLIQNRNPNVQIDGSSDFLMQDGRLL